MSKLPPRRELTHNRVLLAVYGLADAEGLLCKSGRAAIARHAGIGIETTNRYLRMLAEEKVLTARPGGPGRPTLFVLLDHPGSRELLERLDGVRATVCHIGGTRPASW